MAKASDHRSLPDRTLDLYLYPILAWTLVLVALYTFGYAAYALPLVYVLAAWQFGLTAWWGKGLLRRYRSGELPLHEANAGVLSVGHILAASSTAPAMVFLAADPFDLHMQSTCVGIAVVAALAWTATNVTVRLSNRYAHAIALGIACLALPLNATGAVTIGTMVGLWDTVISATPGR